MFSEVFSLLILFALIVFVFGVGLILKPVPTGGGEISVLPLDRRLSFRAFVAVVVVSVLVVAGLIAAYAANPGGFRWAVSRPLERGILRHYHWVMFGGVGLYVITRLCGVEHRRSLWLFCLSLPGALTMPVTFLAALIAGPDRWADVIFEFMLHPATFILPIIAARQWMWLQSPKDIHILSAFAQTLLVVLLYLFAVRLPLP
jgi:hypothetical protein